MKHHFVVLPVLAVFTATLMTTTALAATGQMYTAIPTGQTVTLNGQRVDFAAYNIEGNNYFKLRDLAAAMDGTEKNFNVDYNKERDSVELTSLTRYTTGNQGISKYDGKGNKVARNSPQTMYLDEEKVTLRAYDVSNYNYCKLRDVAALLDFAVDWDPNANVVNIGTDRGLEESITIEKEEPAKPNPTLDISTQKAVQDITKALGPGGAEHFAIEGNYEQKDWDQLVNNPYSSETLGMYFDEYKKYGDIETFKISVVSWLLNNGDDGVAHAEVFG